MEKSFSLFFYEIETFIEHMLLAGAGFEPRMAVSKTAALPLGYAPILNDQVYHIS